jgi:hypothetical protein
MVRQHPPVVTVFGLDNLAPVVCTKGTEPFSMLAIALFEDPIVSNVSGLPCAGAQRQ